MESEQSYTKEYLESFHIPFASHRKEIYVPDDPDTIVAPSYEYLTSHLFTLPDGILIW